MAMTLKEWGEKNCSPEGVRRIQEEMHLIVDR